MNKKVVKLAAYCLTGTLVLSSQAIAASAADISSELPGVGMESVINDCYTASKDASIVEYLNDTVNSEFKDLAIAKVNDYVNIRKKADEESKAVGKLYAGGAATILKEKGEWTKIKSGSVKGYIKTEYLATEDEAEKLADEVGKKVATVKAETLNVREKADEDASIKTQVPIGDELTVKKEKEGWVKVKTSEGTGYVAEDFVEVTTVFDEAISKEEEEAIKAAEEAKKRAEEEARRAEEEAAAAAAQAEQNANSAGNSNSGGSSNNSGSSNSNSGGSSSSSSNSGSGSSNSGGSSKKSSNNGGSSNKSSNSSNNGGSSSSSKGSGSGQAVVNYASQFVGNPYKWGGSSLTKGADCSGFVMAVYKNFGVNLPHSSSAMRSVGKGVSYSNAQPGDIICYSGHVGIYAGNGTIVNALNKKNGITYTSATYKSIITVRRIF